MRNNANKGEKTPQKSKAKIKNAKVKGEKMQNSNAK